MMFALKEFLIRNTNITKHYRGFMETSPESSQIIPTCSLRNLLENDCCTIACPELKLNYPGGCCLVIIFLVPGSW